MWRPFGTARRERRLALHATAVLNKRRVLGGKVDWGLVVIEGHVDLTKYLEWYISKRASSFIKLWCGNLTYKMSLNAAVPFPFLSSMTQKTFWFLAKILLSKLRGRPSPSSLSKGKWASVGATLIIVLQLDLTRIYNSKIVVKGQHNLRIECFKFQHITSQYSKEILGQTKRFLRGCENFLLALA